MTGETVSERIERARSQNMDASLVDTDPVVVQVYNDDSDRIHTVIPESVHCSCEDHTYRSTICKHIIRLLLDDSHLGEVMREALTEYRNDVENRLVDLQAEVEELQYEREAVTEVLNELDLDHDAPSTDGAGAELVASIGSEEPREDSDELTELIEDIVGDE